MNTLMRNAVIIADQAPSRAEITLGTRDLEYASARDIADLMEAARAVVSQVSYYAEPQAFVRNIDRHVRDVVISIWSGQASRNRRALVPAICETHGIPYVGADAYTHILCQDKALAKRFCVEFGFEVPRGQLVSQESDLARIAWLTPPLVVKPNFEGGSIGISEASLVSDHEEAVVLTRKLLELYHDSILVEEFVGGREISIVYAGRNPSACLMEAIEIYSAQVPDLWENRLYSYEIKKTAADVDIEHRHVTDQIPENLLQSSRTLIQSLGKVELLRIDGRLVGEQFYIIELTPDVHLGRDATAFAAFAAAGYTYEQMIRMLLTNAS